MKFIFAVYLVIFAFCNAAPAPEPVPVPEPKANPSFVLTTNPVVAQPIVSYSHYFKSPAYHTYSPYVYNLGYATGYSYNTYPYYVPIHIIH